MNKKFSFNKNSEKQLSFNNVAVVSRDGSSPSSADLKNSYPTFCRKMQYNGRAFPSNTFSKVHKAICCKLLDPNYTEYYVIEKLWPGHVFVGQNH